MMDSSDDLEAIDRHELQIRLFGECDVRIDGERLPPPEHRKAQTLLAYLVLNRDRPQQFGEIAMALWPESQSGQAGVDSVRTHLSCLRQWLDTECSRISKPSKSSVQIDLRNAWIDLDQFQGASKSAESGTLLDAVDLYRGGFLVGFNGPWVEAQRKEFDAVCREVRDRLVRTKSGEDAYAATQPAVESLPEIRAKSIVQPPGSDAESSSSHSRIHFGLAPVLGLMAMSAIVGAMTFGGNSRQRHPDTRFALPKPAATEVIVDDAHRAARQDQFGFWNWGKRTWTPVNGAGINGQYLKVLNNRTGKLQNVGEWRPELPKRANYEISVYIPEAENLVNNALYEIWIAGARQHRKEINQASHNGEWVSLGTYPLYDDAHDFVRLLDVSHELPKYIVFDAMKFTLKE